MNALRLQSSLRGCWKSRVRWDGTQAGFGAPAHGKSAFLRGSAIYFGKYELLSRINIGGMAEIVKARDALAPGQRLVAIKRILPHLCDDQQYKDMFMDESRVLAQLDHASIIRAYEIGEIEDTPYIALEYVDGQDARTLFEETRRSGARVPIGLACFIIARVCEGLHHAHEQTDAHGQQLGIVHRDVSLQNILLSYDGDVKLTDFGIAASAENEARTDVGVVKGKFGYMSPEQIKGSTLDRRSDVFAAGICLYELLTSERLFSGESDWKAVERVRNVDVTPPSALNRQIPSGLERIVMKALAKHPRDRYQSTNDMRRSLQAFMAEVNEFVSQEDLANYLRHTFADDLAGARDLRPIRPSEPVTAAQVMPQEPITGLSKFDDLEPVSSMRFMERPDPSAARHDSGTLQLPSMSRLPPVPSSPFRPAPSVPPLIPRADSIPASVHSRPTLATPQAPVQRSPNDPGWDEEEPTTVAHGFADMPFPTRSHEEEPTRPLSPDDTAPGLAAVRGDEARANVWQDMPSARSTPTLETQRPALAVAPGLVLIGVCASAAVVLCVYLLREHGVATLRLQTDPQDALVSVDGHSASGPRSPFVFSDLSASASHEVLVQKPGYTSWSTRLRVGRDKTLDLPVVKLERLAAAPLVLPAPPAAAEPIAQAGAPAPEASEAHARNDAPRTNKRAPVVKHGQPQLPSSPKPKASASAQPATAAVGGGMGTLRVNTRPWSQVSIDGKAIGNTPQMNLQLRAGTHTVVLSNPEFGVTKSLVVTIKPDETVTRVLTLAP